MIYNINSEYTFLNTIFGIHASDKQVFKVIFTGDGIMLETGIKAPEFSLPDQNGTIHKLSDYRGQKVILYFYPKDSTSGCTKQACGFAERYPQFREKGAVVLGVSKDSVASHQKFEEKNNLPFTILSDTELECIKAYDVWQEKNMYGKKTMGVVRTTYLIDEEGIIVKVYGKVKAADNPQDMLDELTTVI
jgi:peroxiredoxin Q/BCP